MKISVKLQGGLGNQLFQVFTAYSYSIKHKVQLTLPTGLITNDRPVYWNNILRPFKRHTNRIIPVNEYIEPKFTYTELPKFEKSTTLVGYFQSHKYFNYETINLEQPIQDVISIHFRYGDYKNYQEFHPLLGYDYYHNAMQHMLGVSKHKKILYFSETDDALINDIVNRLERSFNVTLEKVCALSDWEQLLLMSSCRYNIIANSTFSWWAAYLNGQNKTVCCPDTWFGHKLNHSVEDLLLDSWQRIKV
jgi:hypothetical protein